MPTWTRGNTPPDNGCEALGAYIMFDANPYARRHPPFKLDWKLFDVLELSAGSGGLNKLTFRKKYEYKIKQAMLLPYGYLDIDGTQVQEEVLIAYGMDTAPSTATGHPLTDNGTSVPSSDTEMLGRKIRENAPNACVVQMTNADPAEWLRAVRKDFRPHQWDVKLKVHGQKPSNIEVEKAIVIPVFYVETGGNPRTFEGILAVGYVGGGAY